MALDKRWSDGAVGVHCVEDDDHQDELLKVKEEVIGKHENYHDDITGQPLDPVRVREARRQALEYSKSKEVLKLVPRQCSFSKDASLASRSFTTALAQFTTLLNSLRTAMISSWRSAMLD